MALRLGIVGFGVVGKSVLEFVTSPAIASHAKTPDSANDFQKIFSLIGQLPAPTTEVVISVWDGRILSVDEQSLLKQHNVIDCTNGFSLEQFCNDHDLLIISAGVDLRLYERYASKFVTELDIYHAFFHQPSLAITGTVGKTTITQLTGQLFMRYDHPEDRSAISPDRVVIAGNIGKGLLDLVPHQDSIDCAVIELSSFQLERSTTFAPRIGIWSNLYPNHLDRHGDMESYCRAKAQLFVHQRPTDVALLDINLLQELVCLEILRALPSQKIFISAEQPAEQEWELVQQVNGSVITVKNGAVCHLKADGSAEQLMELSQLPTVGFVENWLFALATLWAAGKPINVLKCEELEQIYAEAVTLIGANRLELCATVNGVDYYNDSKATVIQATQAALKKLDSNNRPIIVMLGGKPKGVDRRPLVEFLATLKNLKQVICFGPVYDEFAHFQSYPTLDEAFNQITAVACAGDQVLFSPSGTSFDLFTSYTHRGAVYKELVKAHSARLS